MVLSAIKLFFKQSLFQAGCLLFCIFKKKLMGFFKSLMSVISTDGKTGTPFKLDKFHTVYYKGNGVTEIDAAHVAGYYKGIGYFIDDYESDIQISSSEKNDPVQINIIIGGKSVSAGSEDFFKTSVSGLQEFFPERAITINLMDINFKQLKTL